MEKIVIVLMALLLIAGLTACKGGKAGKAEIFGTWEISGRTQYVFAKDGTFKENDTIEKKTTESGSFTLKQGILLMVNKGGQKTKFSVISITTDMAKLHPFRNGKMMKSHRRWKKVN